MLVVCVRACARARACVCVCVCARVRVCVRVHSTIASENLFCALHEHRTHLSTVKQAILLRRPSVFCLSRASRPRKGISVLSLQVNPRPLSSGVSSGLRSACQWRYPTNRRHSSGYFLSSRLLSPLPSPRPTGTLSSFLPPLLPYLVVLPCFPLALLASLPLLPPRQSMLDDSR